MAYDVLNTIGGRPLSGEVRIHTAKNSALYLMLGALLSRERVVLKDVPHLSDIFIMCEMLEHFGAEVFWEGRDLHIHAAEVFNCAAPYGLVSKMRASFVAMGALLGRCGEARISMPALHNLLTIGWSMLLRYVRNAREAVGNKVDTAGLQSFGNTLCLVAADLVGAWLALHAANLTTVLLGLTDISPLASYPALFFLLLLWPIAYMREGLYPGYGITAVQQVQKHMAGSFYIGLVGLVVALSIGDTVALPKVFILFTIVYSILFCPVMTNMTKRLLHHWGLWGRPVIILGANRTGQLVAKVLNSRPLVGLKPVGFFDNDPQYAGASFDGVPVIGNINYAQWYAQANNLQHIFVTNAEVPTHGLRDAVGRREGPSKRIQFVPALQGLTSTNGYASGLHNMLTLELRNNLGVRHNRMFKRTLDILGSAVGLLLLSPLFLTLYLWIRLDSRGPAFHKSRRLGQYGEAFGCFKFRSMYVNADEELERLFAERPDIKEEYELYHKLKDDPRITRAGRVLRRYSLDELPQLINVFLGEMSLVGPRPYLVSELEEMSGQRNVIFEAKPGMTGHWQVSERNNVSFEERLWMEEHYVRNWSVWWDIIILLQTVKIVLKPEGAH